MNQSNKWRDSHLFHTNLTYKIKFNASPQLHNVLENINKNSLHLFSKNLIQIRKLYVL
jgi:hypothetical protein